MNYRAVFASRMSKHGLTPPEYIIANKKLHACHVEGHPPGSENGWYIFSASKPAVGLFGCFEQNLSKIWTSREYRAMIKEGMIDPQNKVAVMKEERKKAKAQYEARTNRGKEAPDAAMLKDSNPETTSLDKVEISNDENNPCKIESLIDKEVTESGQEQRKRLSPPDMTGHMGIIQEMVFGGLQAFYDKEKRLPEGGKAFREFLRFIYIQFNQITRPDYLKKIAKIEKDDTKTAAPCITIKGVKKPKSRKYISTQFYTFKKKFTQQVTPKSLAYP